MKVTNIPKPKSSILADCWKQYQEKQTRKLQSIDGFLLYVSATGVIQAIYCLTVGTFPFNSFLAGFICTVGVFVLTGFAVSLRMQLNPENNFAGYSEQRTVADYLFCNLVLFLAVFNYIG